MSSCNCCRPDRDCNKCRSSVDSYTQQTINIKVYDYKTSKDKNKIKK